MGYEIDSELKTDQDLLDAIKQAASKPLTEEEIREQRISFVYGCLDHDNGVTREKVREVLAEHEGWKDTTDDSI